MDNTSGGTHVEERSLGGRWTIGLPVVAAMCCFGLALITLGSRDLWLDEAFAVTSTHQLLTSLDQRSGSMGLYYVLLTPWSRVSVDPFWIRLPSALFAAGAVALTVRFTLSLFGRRVALWCAAMLLPMWGVVRYAQEARSYSLVMLLTVVTWMLFLRAIDQPSNRAWVLYAVVCAALVYSHPLGGLSVAAQLIVLRAEHPNSADHLKRGLIGWVTLVVLVMPMAVNIVRGTGSAPDWIYPLGTITWTEATTMLAGPNAILQVIVVVALVAASATFVLRSTTSGAADVGTTWHRSAILAWLWISPIGLLLVSFAQPMFLGRYLIGVLPAAAIVLAFGVSRIGVRPARIAVGSALVVVLAVGHVSVHQDPGHRWSAAVEHIASDVSGGETHGVLFLSMTHRQPFELAAAARAETLDVTPLIPAEPWGSFLRYPAAADESAGLATRVDTYDVLWLVEQEPIGLVAEPAPHWGVDEPLESVGFCVDERHRFDGAIEVVRFIECEAS